MKTKFICENNIWLINLNNMSNKIVQRYNSAHFQTSTTFENYEKNEFFFSKRDDDYDSSNFKIETSILLRKMLCHRLFQKKQKLQSTSNLKIIVKNRKKKININETFDLKKKFDNFKSHVQKIDDEKIKQKNQNVIDNVDEKRMRDENSNNFLSFVKWKIICEYYESFAKTKNQWILRIVCENKKSFIITVNRSSMSTMNWS